MSWTTSKLSTFDCCISLRFWKLFVWFGSYGFYRLMLLAHFLERCDRPLNLVIKLFERVCLLWAPSITAYRWLFLPTLLWITSRFLRQLESAWTLANSFDLQVHIWWRTTFSWVQIQRPVVPRPFVFRARVCRALTLTPFAPASMWFLDASAGCCFQDAAVLGRLFVGVGRFLTLSSWKLIKSLIVRRFIDDSEVCITLSLPRCTTRRRLIRISLSWDSSRRWFMMPLPRRLDVWDVHSISVLLIGRHEAGVAVVLLVGMWRLVYLLLNWICLDLVRLNELSARLTRSERFWNRWLRGLRWS